MSSPQIRQPKVLVLRTAGTNCDYETDYAFQLAGAETALVHINQLLSQQVSLSDYQILAIPGGFSYGDDISAGILLANEIRYKLLDAIIDFIEKNGLIIGICNGFQVLVRSGLLPQINAVAQEVSLASNTSSKFECRWTTLTTESTNCVFTQGLPEQIYLPVAHAEGRFIAPEETIDQLESNGQIVFRYASSDYPDNPNGSARNIAGICDPTGRILGMMPHPERYLTRYNHPRWTREDLVAEGDGLAIFRHAVNDVSS